MKIYFFLAVILLNACAKKATVSSQVNEIEEIKVVPYASLPEKIDESSGLENLNGTLFTMNDSGGKDELYLLHEDGSYQKSVQVKNADNTDWESLAANETMLFVGDFGNNNGNREDLTIYALTEWNGDKADNKTITFRYGDQTDFRNQSHNHSFDCEAMIALEDEIILFSKDWANQNTEVYHINLDYENEQIVYASEKKDVGLLITGADYHETNKTLVLCGYMDFVMYLYVFRGAESKKMLTDNYQKYLLQGLEGAQVEGITILNDGTIIISTEKTKAFDQQLWTVDIP